jgi:Tol biopolymer transport system component
MFLSNKSNLLVLVISILLTACGGGSGGGSNGSGSLFPEGITMVSSDSFDVEADDKSNEAEISSDGRYVAFTSIATNLVASDSNNTADSFVHDRLTGETTRVSLASGGGQGNSFSSNPSISGDGRFVAFTSDSSNLVSNDLNLEQDIFVNDSQTGSTRRVSVATGNIEGNGLSILGTISDDGNYVAFVSAANNLIASDTNGMIDIFVNEILTGTTTRVSVPSGSVLESNGGSTAPAISADGRYVTFNSAASNLVSGDSNGFIDVFVHDRRTGNTTRMSISSNGSQANGDSTSHTPDISDDGRYVAFASTASNLVAGDINGFEDIFVHDRSTGATIRVSVASNGSESNGVSTHPVISADGRYIAFESAAGNLVTGDSNLTNDIFIHDRITSTTSRISLNENGDQAAGQNTEVSISADGKNIVFESDAENLVFGSNTFRQGLVYTVTLP